MPFSLQSLLQPCFLMLSEVASHGFISMDPGESVLSGAGGCPKCGEVEPKSPRKSLCHLEWE